MTFPLYVGRAWSHGTREPLERPWRKHLPEIGGILVENWETSLSVSAMRSQILSQLPRRGFFIWHDSDDWHCPAVLRRGLRLLHTSDAPYAYFPTVMVASPTGCRFEHHPPMPSNTIYRLPVPPIRIDPDSDTTGDWNRRAIATALERSPTDPIRLRGIGAVYFAHRDNGGAGNRAVDRGAFPLSLDCLPGPAIPFCDACAEL